MIVFTHSSRIILEIEMKKRRVVVLYLNELKVKASLRTSPAAAAAADFVVVVSVLWTGGCRCISFVLKTRRPGTCRRRFYLRCRAAAT